MCKEQVYNYISKIEDIGFSYLTNQDVVRHPLVQKIVKAYDVYEAKQNREEKKVEKVQKKKRITVNRK